MKNLVLLSLMLLSLNAGAQYLSGIYSGKLVNDSTRKEQNYELALSEYRGKITGYAYTTFVVNDTFYYSVKRIKATRSNGKLIVEDVKMLANNFPESPAKRVKVTNTIPLPEGQDTLINLNGKWETNKTKEYYSIFGALDLKKDSDSAHSTLVAHLTELKLIPPITGSASGPASVAATNNNNNNNKNSGATTTARATGNTGSNANTSVANRTATKNTGTDRTNTKAADSNNTNTAKAGSTGPDNKRADNKSGKTEAPTATTYIAYNERKVTFLQDLNIVSDSIVLSFYDNGVVDGDMISVYINDQNVLSPTRLTEAATKKTVHLNSFNSDSITLILVAENLGSLPPNTGLLVVQDGAKKYEVRFSADLQTNAALVFRKRK